MSTVLVTGGSGFVAGHCLLQLAKAGHQLRTTVRRRAREGHVRDTLARAGMNSSVSLAFFEADLTADAGWREAMQGCDYVLHVASPFPASSPKSDDELIIPARDGALRALRAARDAGVKRLVLTSSFAAVGYGRPVRPDPFNESDWTDLNGDGVTAYVKSKTIAERAAWDFIAREGGGLELSVVNPVMVAGPVLGPDLSTSTLVIQRLLDGGMPLCPRIGFGVVDARDVADLHVRAMTDPAANGERFLATAGMSLSILDIALILRARLGEAARRAPRRELPDWLVRIVALVDPLARAASAELGQRKHTTAEKARRMLGWTPFSREDAVVATAESLIALGLVKGAKG